MFQASDGIEPTMGVTFRTHSTQAHSAHADDASVSTASRAARIVSAGRKIVIRHVLPFLTCVLAYRAPSTTRLHSASPWPASAVRGRGTTSRIHPSRQARHYGCPPTAEATAT